MFYATLCLRSDTEADRQKKEDENLVTATRMLSLQCMFPI